MNKIQFKRFRRKLGLNQQDFAEMLGYSRQATISDKESGKRPITKQDEIIIRLLALI